MHMRALPCPRRPLAQRAQPARARECPLAVTPRSLLVGCGSYVIQNRYRSYKSISAAEARVKMVREAGWSPPEPEVVDYLDTSLRGPSSPAAHSTAPCFDKTSPVPLAAPSPAIFPP